MSWRPVASSISPRLASFRSAWPFRLSKMGTSVQLYESYFLKNASSLHIPGIARGQFPGHSPSKRSLVRLRQPDWAKQSNKQGRRGRTHREQECVSFGERLQRPASVLADPVCVPTGGALTSPRLRRCTRAANGPRARMKSIPRKPTP